MSCSAVLYIHTFLQLTHHITEQNTAPVFCCHDLLICFVTMDFKQYKSSCWHLLCTQTANIHVENVTACSNIDSY